MTNVLINQCLDYRDLCQPTLTLSDTVCPDEVEESDKVCNWNTATALQCLSLYFIFESKVLFSEEYKCMYCYNSSHCVQLNVTNQTDCENLELCVTPNGEIMQNIPQVQ